MIEQQIKAFTKIYGKSEEEIKTKLFVENEGKFEQSEDYDSILLSWDEARVKKWKDERTEIHDKGYGKAKKEVLTDVEKLYRDAGILSDGENYEAVVEKYEALKNTPSKSKLSDDDVKKHPLFLAYEEKIKKEYLPKAEHEEKLREYEDKLNEIERTKKYSKIDEKALDRFNPDDYVLSDDPARKQKQIKLLLAELRNHFDDAELNEDNIVLIKDGKRLEDSHGNLINFDSVVDLCASTLFDKKAQTPKGSVANQNKPDGQKNDSKYVFTAKNGEELKAQRAKFQSEATTPDEKLLIGKLADEYYRKSIKV